MAADAIGAQFASMRFLVAGSARAAKAQEGSVKIFQFDFAAGVGCNFFFAVAVLAVLRAMLAFQSKACRLEMVETLAFQTREYEFLPGMFPMTARAIRLAGGAFVRA